MSCSMADEMPTACFLSRKVGSTSIKRRTNISPNTSM